MGAEGGLLARLRTRFRRLSARRVRAVLIKEFIQLRRDRVTFGMIVGVPLVELVLFGFAINSDPKHLPTAVFVQDHSAYTRAIVNAFGNSGYFRIVASNASETVQSMVGRIGATTNSGRVSATASTAPTSTKPA